MKRIYTVLIALSSMIVGFALSSFYSKSSAPLPLPSTSITFAGNNTTLRMAKGLKQSNYYLNVLTYAADSIAVTGVDSLNSKLGLSISYNSGNYQVASTHGTIDTIPRGIWTTTSYVLIDTTIYARYGILYGTDNTGKPQSFPITDIVSVQGGPGTVTMGVVSLETYE